MLIFKSIRPIIISENHKNQRNQRQKNYLISNAFDNFPKYCTDVSFI